MESKVIEYSGNGIEARVVVTAANMLQGMKRTRLKPNHGDQELQGMDNDALILRVFQYPDMVAAAKEISINGDTTEPTFARFLELPEVFAHQWEDATYELNPHWLPRDDDEKKE